MTIREADQQLISILQRLYDLREAKNIADLVMEHTTGRKKVDRLINKQHHLSPDQEQHVLEYMRQLSGGVPVQYVLQEAWFMGMPFFVNENVLIPRPETEELVAWVAETVKELEFVQPALPKALNLLDVGTGSGCIPLAIKKLLPSLNVYSCDISTKALEVARKNGSALNLPVNFLELDFLDKESRQLLPEVDILVSNPPYIPLAEKQHLADHVVSFEPHTALFVPNQDPLVFYRSLIEYMFHQQRPVRLFAEIHEDFGADIIQLFSAAHLNNIELRKDMQGKDRMISASL